MTWQLFEVLAWRRLQSERAAPHWADVKRFRKMAAIRSNMVQSWPSWALNDHKE